MSVFGKIEAPYWDDKPCAIVAGGLSLRGFDLERLRPYHVLAVKGSIFDMPWAAAGFGLDLPRYLEWEHERKFKNISFPVYWAVDDVHNTREVLAKKKSDCVVFVKRLQGEKLSGDSGTIYNGGSSGFGALQIAWLKKAKHIVLFGYDYANPPSSGGMVKHHNDQHYSQKRQAIPASWAAWATYFQHVVSPLNAAGVQVLNASPDSAITAFKKCTTDEALEHMGRLRSA